MTKKFTDEFKKDAVRQVVENGYPVPEVAERLGIGLSTLQRWKTQHAPVKTDANGFEKDLRSENAKLRAEVRRLKEERDILKKAAAYFAKQSL